jgi:uncharacterized protein
MIELIPLSDSFVIYKVENTRHIPPEIIDSDFFSITKTNDEVSILSNCRLSFPGVLSEHGWKGFKVAGILDFSLIGIINDITFPMKENSISVFVISTFNTDYLFVKEVNFERAIDLFIRAENIKIKVE